MFSYLKLDNFKSFKRINFDFRGKNKLPQNLVFIYGENGAGKTHLVSAFQFLAQTIETLNFQNMMSNIAEDMKKNDRADFTKFREIQRIPFFFKDLKRISKDARTIGTTDDLVLEFGFNLDGIEGRYRLVFNDFLKEESLYYLLDKNRGYLFKITNDNISLSNKVFTKDYKETLEDLIEQFWGKHTFLSILNNEMEIKNRDYIVKRVNQSLFKVMSFFTTFSIKSKSGNEGMISKFGSQYPSLFNLDNGILPLSKEHQLVEKENIVRDFLTSIYSDIKDVYYEREIDSEDGKIKYQLYIKKLIGGKLRDIDFSLESTGTQNLLSLYLPLVEAVLGNTTIIDEADEGIHDILFNSLIESVMDNMKGQLIVTTHNTTLLEKLKNENIYFILVDINGNKKIVNINYYDQRTQVTHNIRERYLKGMYGAIPYTGSLDFDSIMDLAHNDQESGD